MWTIICLVICIGCCSATLSVFAKIHNDTKWWLKLLLVLLFVFDVVFFMLTLYLSDYYKTIKYRERNKPTIEDVADGYAKVDTIIIIRNGEQQEKYEIVWIGNQKGKREQ